jgi:transcriptional regulator with XRE-family HTH domain
MPPDRLERWLERRKQVGSRIREIRMSQGLTQMSLALEAGLSRNMIIGIEFGKKSVAYERLWDIADVLDVDVREFFSEGSAAPSSRAAGPGSAGGRAQDRSSAKSQAG